MKLVKDTSAGAYAVTIPCVHESHQGYVMVRLADAYADLEGRAFVDYYCDKCVERHGLSKFITEESK